MVAPGLWICPFTPRRGLTKANSSSGSIHTRASGINKRSGDFSPDLFSQLFQVLVEEIDDELGQFGTGRHLARRIQSMRAALYDHQFDRIASGLELMREFRGPTERNRLFRVSLQDHERSTPTA